MSRGERLVLRQRSQDEVPLFRAVGIGDHLAGFRPTCRIVQISGPSRP